ncbi:UNVERIFIED_CONTAM: E3 ubiquitin-protein ligase UPL6 [Sesamum latifolium]|uniref:HECT-type E3 ubiquitin transferase n=1 Tax=Sesamum latifolium TaxID=2727402 RepID=A0AAW2XUA9_9LAMI
MFFTGDPSTRKRVDLGGRSSKERDRQKLLEQTRLERNRRLWLRQQNAAALKIQVPHMVLPISVSPASVFSVVLSPDHLLSLAPFLFRQCFGPDSDFLYQLLFFFNPRYVADFLHLLRPADCFLNLFMIMVSFLGDVVSLFAGMDYSSKRGLVEYRIKNLAYACVRAIYENRNQLKDQLFLAPEKFNRSANVLLEAIILLIDLKLPWACNTVCYLSQRNMYSMFREIILMGKFRWEIGTQFYFVVQSASPVSIFLDSVFLVWGPCSINRDQIRKSHTHSDIMTYGYVKKHLQGSTGTTSSLERVLAVIISHVDQTSCTCSNSDPRSSFSSQILIIPFLWRLFPHLKEIFAAPRLSQHYVHQMALCVKDHTNVLPADISSDFPSYACLLGNLLEAAGVAITQPGSFAWAMDFATVATFLLQALPPLQTSNQGDKCATGGHFADCWSHKGRPDDNEVAAVGAACSFLHVTFNILPLERIMTVLAYRTELVPILWNFMKRCHENDMWSSLSEQSAYLPVDTPGWLLPLSVFCPVYKHMLMIVDNEEFYEQEKPLSLVDIRLLIVILRQALWQILWLNPVATPNFSKSADGPSAMKRRPIEFLQHRVAWLLLNSCRRREFTSPNDFNADGASDLFMSQAMTENTRANDILKQAPFLVPFTSRAKIFNSQLATMKERNSAHAIFTRNRFKIRRDHILEDAFSQLNALAEEDLRGVIRITFVNEFGVEEAGIDGGGIFKDFMENITRAAFDVQYGLLRLHRSFIQSFHLSIPIAAYLFCYFDCSSFHHETADHLLYPNPGSGLIHEQHLQFFHFLGTILAKAMFEGILVDIPFATFFLSKLKQKYNYLNDLPSLDPELYRHLIFLKHYGGDISELELYFVIVNNEYGEQTEEELLPGGKNIRVTNENVITFIHLVANHRLNFQDHYVIEMFWEVIQNLSLENKRKFLNKQQMEQKLLYAINSDAGFDLS